MKALINFYGSDNNYHQIRHALAADKPNDRSKINIYSTLWVYNISVLWWIKDVVEDIKEISQERNGSGYNFVNDSTLDNVDDAYITSTAAAAYGDVDDDDDDVVVQVTSMTEHKNNLL